MKKLWKKIRGYVAVGVASALAMLWWMSVRHLRTEVKKTANYQAFSELGGSGMTSEEIRANADRRAKEATKDIKKAKAKEVELRFHKAFGGKNDEG